MVSLVAPVLMVILAALDFAGAVRETVDAAAWGQVPVRQLLSLLPLLGGPAAVMAGWLAVVLLGLAGRRRAAAALASIPLALALANLLVELIQLSGAWSGGLPLFLFMAGDVGPIVLASVAACSLAFSAGPRRGLAIGGRRRACLMIAGLSAGFGFFAVVQLLSPTASLAAPVLSLLDVLAIVVAVLVTGARSAVGWRVAVLVATGLLLNLAGVPFAGTMVLLLASLGFAVLVWPVAMTSWRGHVRQASRAG